MVLKNYRIFRDEKLISAVPPYLIDYLFQLSIHFFIFNNSKLARAFHSYIGRIIAFLQVKIERRDLSLYVDFCNLCLIIHGI